MYQLHRLTALACVQAKTEIAAEVKEALQKSMESFGFIIIETLVGGPPADCANPAGLLQQLQSSVWLFIASSTLPHP